MMDKSEVRRKRWYVEFGVDLSALSVDSSNTPGSWIGDANQTSLRKAILELMGKVRQPCSAMKLGEM